MDEVLQPQEDLLFRLRSKSFRFLFVSLFVIGCSTVPKLKDPIEQSIILNEICKRGDPYESVHGSVWIKIKDSNHQGQFPAQVRLTKEEGLILEIQNLLGAKIALITVRPGQYSVDSYSKRLKSFSGGSHYFGIPNDWIVHLFRGKIPCPKNPISLQQPKAGVLEVLDESGWRFEYQMTQTGSFLWVDRELVFSPDGVRYEFLYSDPEYLNSNPRSWEIRTERGEMSLRWRDRKTVESE
jgi:hypothetical protein